MHTLRSGGAIASSFAYICCGQVPFFTKWWNIASVLWFLFNQNIKKYLLTEAREKNRPEFLQGWQTAVTKVSVRWKWKPRLFKGMGLSEGWVSLKAFLDWWWTYQWRVWRRQGSSSKPYCSSSGCCFTVLAGNR